MNIWEKKFSTFSVANKFKKGLGFRSNKWRDSQLNHFKLCNTNNKIPKELTYRYLEFVKIIKKNSKKRHRFNILDVGGGFGLGFYLLKEKLKINNLNYTIIENYKIINEFKNKNLQVKYINKINFNNKYDIVNCCSVIQYVNNWKKLVNDLAKTNTKLLYFSDMFLGKISTYATLQNYYDNKIPHWFINFDEFNNLLHDRGYRLIMKKKMLTYRLGKKNLLSMNNFSKEDRIKNTLNLLYKKI